MNVSKIGSARQTAKVLSLQELYNCNIVGVRSVVVMQKLMTYLIDWRLIKMSRNLYFNEYSV